jgi:Ca2+-binding EF-hand superfamily protein
MILPIFSLHLKIQMIGMFKIQMGQAKGLDADSRRNGQRVSDLFNNLDVDASSAVGKSEITKYMKLNKMNLNDEQIDDIMKTFKEMGKINDDGEVPHDEFVGCLLSRLS